MVQIEPPQFVMSMSLFLLSGFLDKSHPRMVSFFAGIGDLMDLIPSMNRGNRREWQNDQPIAPNWYEHCLSFSLDLQTVAANGALCRLKWD